MTGQSIAGTVGFVTGANRGIGRALVEALVERGASKVYAAARRPETLRGLAAAHGERVVPVTLDVTRREQVRGAAEAAGDVSLLINNAGVAADAGGRFPVEEGWVDAARHELEVNVLGLLDVTRAFAPVLEANGGGSVVNLASVAALVHFPLLPSYSASKAAVHSLTQGMRMALGGQGTRVVGVYPGPVDTDMAEGVPFEKTSPEAVAAAILDAVEAGTEEVLPDPMSAQLGGLFFHDPKELERQVAAMAAG